MCMGQAIITGAMRLVLNKKAKRNNKIAYALISLTCGEEPAEALMGNYNIYIYKYDSPIRVWAHADDNTQDIRGEGSPLLC